LKISEDAYRNVILFGQLYYVIDDLKVVFMASMGKIESENIHTLFNQLKQSFLAIAGRTYSSYNLCFLS